MNNELSTRITEEASKLRADAATSIIQNELYCRDIDGQFATFKIESATADELADKEYKQVLDSWKKVRNLLQQVISTLVIASSAISASIYPTNSAAKLTTIINNIDSTNNYLRSVESKLSQFNESSDLVRQMNILSDVQDKLSRSLQEIKNTLSNLHLLLFGDGQT